MIFYFRLITQPCFMLDLNYKDQIANVVKGIRKLPTLPSKQSNAKLFFDTSKYRANIAHFLGTLSVHGDSDTRSVGLSEPERARESSNRKNNSSAASGSEPEKSSESIANSYVVKYFGPLFEEYRRLKADMKFALLGSAVHVPFGQVPVMKGSEKPPATVPGSRKALLLPASKLLLGAVELKSNDFANSIIDESQLSTKERLSTGSKECNSSMKSFTNRGSTQTGK